MPPLPKTATAPRDPQTPPFTPKPTSSECSRDRSPLSRTPEPDPPQPMRQASPEPQQPVSSVAQGDMVNGSARRSQNVSSSLGGSRQMTPDNVLPISSEQDSAKIDEAVEAPVLTAEMRNSLPLAHNEQDTNVPANFPQLTAGNGEKVVENSPAEPMHQQPTASDERIQGEELARAESIEISPLPSREESVRSPRVNAAGQPTVEGAAALEKEIGGSVNPTRSESMSGVSSLSRRSEAEDEAAPTYRSQALESPGTPTPRGESAPTVPVEPTQEQRNSEEPPRYSDVEHSSPPLLSGTRLPAEGEDVKTSALPDQSETAGVESDTRTPTGHRSPAHSSRQSTPTSVKKTPPLPRVDTRSDRHRSVSPLPPPVPRNESTSFAAPALPTQPDYGRHQSVSPLPAEDAARSLSLSLPSPTLSGLSDEGMGNGRFGNLNQNLPAPSSVTAPRQRPPIPAGLPPAPPTPPPQPDVPVMRESSWARSARRSIDRRRNSSVSAQEEPQSRSRPLSYVARGDDPVRRQHTTISTSQQAAKDQVERQSVPSEIPPLPQDSRQTVFPKDQKFDNTSQFSGQRPRSFSRPFQEPNLHDHPVYRKGPPTLPANVAAQNVGRDSPELPRQYYPAQIRRQDTLIPRQGTATEYSLPGMQPDDPEQSRQRQKQRSSILKGRNKSRGRNESVDPAESEFEPSSARPRSRPTSFFGRLRNGSQPDTLSDLDTNASQRPGSSSTAQSKNIPLPEVQKQKRRSFLHRGSSTAETDGVGADRDSIIAHPSGSNPNLLRQFEGESTPIIENERDKDRPTSGNLQRESAGIIPSTKEASPKEKEKSGKKKRFSGLAVCDLHYICLETY